MPESRASRPRRFDPAAQILIMILLAGLTAGIIEGPAERITLIVACFAAVLGRRLHGRIDLRCVSR